MFMLGRDSAPCEKTERNFGKSIMIEGYFSELVVMSDDELTRGRLTSNKMLVWSLV